MISLLSGRRNFFIEVPPRFYQGQHFYGCQEGAAIQFFLSAWLIQTLFQDALINRYKSTFSWKDQYGEEKRHQCEFSADDGEGPLSTFTCTETWKLLRPLCPCDLQMNNFSAITVSHIFLWGFINQKKKRKKERKKKENGNKSGFLVDPTICFFYAGGSVCVCVCVCVYSSYKPKFPPFPFHFLIKQKEGGK